MKGFWNWGMRRTGLWDDRCRKESRGFPDWGMNGNGICVDIERMGKDGVGGWEETPLLLEVVLSNRFGVSRRNEVRNAVALCAVLMYE